MSGAGGRARLVTWGAAAALAVAGLAYDPLAEAAEPKRVLGLVVAAIGLAWWIARTAPHRPMGWGARAAVAFVAMSAVSLTWGLPCGARDLGTWAAALGAGAIAARLGPRLGVSTARIAALAMGSGASLVAVASALRGRPVMALHAGQGNPNWLGLLLAVTLPLSIDALVAWREETRARRGALAMSVMAQVAALYLSHSRVGWIAAAVACVAQVALAARGKAVRRTVAAAATLAILFAAGSAAAERDVPADLALRGRAWIWRVSAHAATRALPFGAGLGRFGHAYLDAQGEDLARATSSDAARRFVNATTAHDEYLQVAVESGPFAAMLLVWALLLGAYDHARARWLGGAAALGACAVASLADSPLRQPAVALVVGLVLGVPLQRPPSQARRIAPAAALLAAVAWLLYGATREWVATRERTRAMDAEPAARVTMLARSARTDPASGEAALDLGLARLAAGDARGSLDALRRADAQMADTGARIALGSALLTEGDAAGAEKAYRRALAWNPGSFRARLGLAEALFASHALDAAEREALVAHKVLPGDPRSRELLDRIREAKMDE